MWHSYLKCISNFKFVLAKGLSKICWHFSWLWIFDYFTIFGNVCHFLNTNYINLTAAARMGLLHFSCSVVSDSLRPPQPQHARPACPSLTSRVYPLISMESMMPFNHLILCRPLLLPPSIFPSIRVFSKKSALCIMWPKYWSFSFSISPSNEHSSGLLLHLS